ncbi:hoar protein [Gynaephora ruoergensis nucleopolyhedrovirus]|nr:hoar protein [Gynaephora ruoergensis nucleopolyhedrovirus]
MCSIRKVVLPDKPLGIGNCHGKPLRVVVPRQLWSEPGDDELPEVYVPGLPSFSPAVGDYVPSTYTPLSWYNETPPLYDVIAEEPFFESAPAPAARFVPETPSPPARRRRFVFRTPSSAAPETVAPPPRTPPRIVFESSPSSPSSPPAELSQPSTSFGSPMRQSSIRKHLKCTKRKLCYTVSHDKAKKYIQSRIKKSNISSRMQYFPIKQNAAAIYVPDSENSSSDSE